jgi:hypothetical protein
VHRIATALLTLVSIPTFACSSGTPSWQEQETRNHPRQHVMVQFTDMSLHPSTAQVLAGGSVSWVNYASMYAGSVVFSDAVAAAFTCKELRPNWMKTGTGYQSIPIPMGGASNDLQLPCPLKPGEYDYELWLFSNAPGGFEAMENPQSQLSGKIIVQ